MRQCSRIATSTVFYALLSVAPMFWGCAQGNLAGDSEPDAGGTRTDATHSWRDAGGSDAGTPDAGRSDGSSGLSDTSAGDSSSDTTGRDGSSDADPDGASDGGDTCVPATCRQLHATCGTVSDGCGGTLNCGTCPSGQTCSNNQCVCQPTTCSKAGAQCGTVSDGCGGTLNCGACGSGQTCSNNQCVCQPTTCSQAGAQCGTISDGCGGTLNCGSCIGNKNCVNNTCQFTQHTIFVTSSQWEGGNVGGASSADSKCQTAATNAGLSGTWKAIISEYHGGGFNVLNARDRITIRAPIYNTNGDKVADNATDVWNPPIENGIRYDENGRENTSRVWTGTDENGDATQYDCNTWTSSGSTTDGTEGYSSLSSGGWLDTGHVGCFRTMSLYCIDGQ